MTTSPDTERGLLGWLWRQFLKKYTGLLFLALLFMALEGSMMGALSYMMKPMFDQVFLAESAGALRWVGMIIMGIFITRGFSGFMQKSLMAKITEKTAADIRTGLLGHLMTQDGGFHQDHPPGYLIERVQTDVASINNVWSQVISGAGKDFVSLMVLLGVAISVDWRWTLIAIIGAPVVVLPSRIVQRFIRGRAREAREISARLATRLDEVFHGINAVKLNRLEGYQSDRFANHTRAMVRANVRARSGAALIPGMVDIVAGASFVAVLYFGARDIVDGSKTVGDFMAFFTAIGMAFEPVRRLANISGNWQIAAAAIERLRGLLETVPTLQSPENPHDPPNGVPAIHLKDVHLSYGDTKVLNGLTLTAKSGKTTALVGASGAGKSTIFNVLTRLVDPQDGRVLVGGVEIHAMALQDLRSLFAVVSQDAALFDETLRENILLGRNDVDDTRLQQVLDAAHVSDFLDKLPDGLDSPVGPRGSALSGGQRQRVAIARALLSDAPILLLDEATSALDAESERVVQDALEDLSEGRTTLVIAHRLSTVRDADKIIVMDKGRVEDSGTHDELLSRGGIYAHLYDLQFRTDGPSADSLAQDAAGRRRRGIGSEAIDYDGLDDTSLVSRIFGRWFGR